VQGDTLVLEWQNWGPERLQFNPDGTFRSPDGAFTLQRVRGR
jgi:hypothetical protein